MGEDTSTCPGRSRLAISRLLFSPYLETQQLEQIFFKNKFIYLAALGLPCCARAFSSCGERGLLLFAVCCLLIAVASLCCGAPALDAWASVGVACRLSSCGLWALERMLSSCGARA